ncbi:MAG: class I SAM-dependent methyltransferase [Mycetocola sp.]
MTQEFDKTFWESHWQQRDSSTEAAEPNPYLVRETASLTPGSALDAGCGEGAEAIWLARQGWTVTAADISAEALAHAAGREGGHEASEPVEWVEADLGLWAPGRHFDLVATHYAHLPTSQLEFYRRLSRWVSPGGTLLIVGHLQAGRTGEHGHRHGHGGHPPVEATVTAESIIAVLDPADWRVETAVEPVREITTDDGTPATIGDVVVRATRRR